MAGQINSESTGLAERAVRVPAGRGFEASWAAGLGAAGAWRVLDPAGLPGLRRGQRFELLGPHSLAPPGDGTARAWVLGPATVALVRFRRRAVVPNASPHDTTLVLDEWVRA